MRELLLLANVISCQFYSPFVINNTDALSEVQLNLNQGSITGLRFDGFDVYRGVPYAKPPGRFEHAQMIESFSNFDARNFGPSCFQAPGYSFFGYSFDLGINFTSWLRDGVISEDCLTLDIYIPQSQSAKGVLVFIHGGGYYSGDSRSFSGIEHALSQSNVVVIIQYRLGIFGFFNAFDTNTQKSIGGNYALSDAALAIGFIHQNAANLGADENKIILNGESAGAGMIMALLLHDETASQISGAFVQSGGTAFNFFTSVTGVYCNDRF